MGIDPRAGAPASPQPPVRQVCHIWVPQVDGFVRRERAHITYVVVHRIEVSQEDPTFGDSPAEIARFFHTHPIGVQATGGKMPYPIVILADGTVVQTVPLQCITPHARHHNPTGIGVACVGDFRARAPDARQWCALVDVCSSLVRALTLTAAAVVGHDELAEGSHDPDKECPGRHLCMTTLRQQVELAMQGQKASACEFCWDPQLLLPG